MRGPEELSQIDRFYVFGVGLGGLLPVGGFWALHWFGLKLIPAELSFTFGMTALVFLSAFAGAFLIPRMFHGVTEHIILKPMALLSIICLNIFVITTGGPMVSLFSYHYLYIPVVVGYALGWKALTQAAWGCAITYFLAIGVNQFAMPWLSPNSVVEFAKIGQDPWYIGAYSALFILQLYVACVFAKQSLPKDVAELSIDADPGGAPV